jgi:hypothetical protein
LFIAGFILVALLIWLGGGRVWAQGLAGDRPHYVPRSNFRIPFNIDANSAKVLEVQLFVSEDQGQTWQKAASAAPEQAGFHFRAERDGLYFFTVRTVDVTGKANPPTVQGVAPQIRVYVDTQLPLVSLHQAPYRNGMVGVEWEIREENLDVNSLFLEYRTTNSADWIPLTVEGGRTGQRYWNPGPVGNIEVRLKVRDLAKNEGEARLRINPNGGDGGSDSRQFGGNYGDPDAGRNMPPGSSRNEPRFVNSTRISLNYQITEEGPSGSSAVELWATRDGRTWDKIKEESSQKPPLPLVVDVKGEGIYGFTLLVRSGVGLSEREPRGGDAPQVWVEVDLQKPIVEYVDTKVDPGPDLGKLTIAWKATDKNMARDPIRLSYSKDPEGPWTEIASSQPNTGAYVWRMQTSGIPYQFYVQVEAIDKAGNVGSRRTEKMVKVDLKKPKSVILDIGPANAGGASKPDIESNKR